MPKVILIGSQKNQWQIGKGFQPGGLVIELTDSEVKKHKKIIAEMIDKPKEVKVKIYTANEIDKKGRTWQFNWLKKHDIKPASREADRIKQIMEAQ